ncbi:dynamin family protein [Agathobacter sp.]
MGMFEDINQFVDTMIEEQNCFENMQSEVSKKEDDVLQELSRLKTSERECIDQIQLELSKNNDEDMQKIFTNTSEIFFNALSDSNKKIEEAIKGMTFIHDFEKHFTVSVFGKVKAGKSYIGNFIMGNTLRKEGIASSYDKLSDLTVHVYDRGKMYEQNKLSTAVEKKECNGEEFYVDKNEATSTIQWVNIGGLCWFDTPGIGSVTIENEELAKEYVKNSDLVIFACNSDAAGTRQEFFEIKQLHDMNKPILLLLTQSDAYDYDVDEAGDEISILVPKSDKDRKDQEDYMLETLREQGMEDVLKYADILTVSALLATEAVKNNDEIMFEQSNMGKLLEKLTSITKNDAAEIKKNTPKSRINEMIDSIIKDLENVSAGINNYCDAIQVNKQNLLDRKAWMIEQIRASLRIKIDEIVGTAKAEIESNGNSISESDLSEKINSALIEIVQKVCAEEALNQNNELPNLEIKLTGIGDMKMRQDRIPYEYVSVVQVPRKPESPWEKFRNKFGKQYYDLRVKRYSSKDTL